MALSGKVVIGAGFGDEGKGVLTDALAAEAGNDCLVIRFNGGAQAGHTVVTPAGQRHVFSHFGSGSFTGAATFLSRFFLCNPILFLKEARLLEETGVRPRVFVDPEALVTTPYDMMINHAAEQIRGSERHGSCGVGIGETVGRSADPQMRLTAADLTNVATLRDTLRRIRSVYVSQRLWKLGMPLSVLGELLASDDILYRFVEDSQEFLSRIEFAGAGLLRRAGDLVFEGAQGLLLDQDRGFFPHVTRSNTGLRNVLQLAQEASLRQLDVTYVTRCYLTRHGAGPLPNEIGAPPYPAVQDPTNLPNRYQGALRFGWLDEDFLAATIAQDQSDAAPHTDLRVRAGLAVTCLDQCGDSVRVLKRGQLMALSSDSFLQSVASATSAQWLYAGHGPSRRDLHSVSRRDGTKDSERGLLPMVDALAAQET